jgi:hypothetical protein
MAEDGEWVKAPKSVVDAISRVPNAPDPIEKEFAERMKKKGEKKVEATASKKYSKTATNAAGVKIGWNGTAWEDVKTGKVIQ